MRADHLMHVREVAAYLGMAPASIYHLVSEGRIPCIHLSARCLRFRRSDIDAWIAAKGTNPSSTNSLKGQRKR